MISLGDACLVLLVIASLLGDDLVRIGPLVSCGFGGTRGVLLQAVKVNGALISGLGGGCLLAVEQHVNGGGLAKDEFFGGGQDVGVVSLVPALRCFRIG